MSYLANNVSFSYNNKYADMFYNARKKLQNADKQLITFRKNPENSNPAKEKELKEELIYWQSKLPKISKKAQNEEKLIAQRKNETSKNSFYNTPHSFQKINYLA